MKRNIPVIILMVLATVALIFCGLDSILGWGISWSNPFFLWLTILLMSYNVFTLQEAFLDD